jgi:uncharacterized membrane protein YhiD involved in acid resistance
MQFLIVINKILDLRIVQYALLAAVVFLSVLSGVQSFRLWVSQKEAKYQKSKAAESEAFLTTQSAQVLEMKKQGDAAKIKIDAAKAEERKIAADYERRIQILKKRPIREDCCGAIEDAKNIILGGTP